MNEIREASDEVFLVCQDNVVATIHVNRSPPSWSVHVFEIQQPNHTTLYLDRGFAAVGTLEDARRLGTEAALKSIAEVLHREVDQGGHVVRVVAHEIANDPGNYEGYVEAIDRDGFVTNKLLATLAGRTYQTAQQAVEIGRTGLKRVVGVSEDGEILI
ncbi:MAG: hypothetical protein ACRES5_05670 [Pseudomonas sp.]|uniref:hypothetical protein n=1 Tax=Stenotrophomonas sp. TaxID=69392 RepID=UPI003D6D6243